MQNLILTKWTNLHLAFFCVKHHKTKPLCCRFSSFENPVFDSSKMFSTASLLCPTHDHRYSSDITTLFFYFRALVSRVISVCDCNCFIFTFFFAQYSVICPAFRCPCRASSDVRATLLSLYSIQINVQLLNVHTSCKCT